jgi:hypothetical protein
VILLAGGTKRRQQHDIATAQARWADYKSDERRKSEMALTKEFKETVKARADRDPAFRQALLTEAAEQLLSGDLETGKRSCAITSTPPLGSKRSPKPRERLPRASCACWAQGVILAPAICSLYWGSCNGSRAYI